LGFAGMMERAASATNDASLSSEPYCFEAMTGLRADTRVSCVKGDGRLKVDSSVKVKYRLGCCRIRWFSKHHSYCNSNKMARNP